MARSAKESPSDSVSNLIHHRRDIFPLCAFRFHLPRANPKGKFRSDPPPQQRSVADYINYSSDSTMQAHQTNECSPAARRIPGVLPNAASCVFFDRSTGFQPVREDRASRLSANETTGWKPVGQDRQDACPPTKLALLGVLLVALALQSGLIQGRELVSSDPVPASPAGMAAEPARAGDRLTPGAFVDPPVHVRPGCFWDWLNGSITKEQITRDLEAMKQGGMRGGEIWDVAACADPDGRVPAGPAFLGPESTRLIVHAIREADRLGLEIGIVASSGWNAGGSWIPPEHAGKGIYQSVTTVTGPKDLQAELPLPELPKRCPRDAQGRPVYLREVAVLAVPHDKAQTLADVNQVVDLSKMTDADGRLRWQVPAGEWDILRFVCANHGQQLIVPSPNSGGPMIDFFDPRATEFHLNYIVTTILKELGRKSFEGTSFKTLEFDSMELDGFTPWNETMTTEFQRRVGYPVIRFLPVLAGWKLADQVVHEQFLYDWRKLVSDLLIDSHYVMGRKFLESYGVKLIAESGGPGPPI
jgi:hypothetical protein